MESINRSNADTSSCLKPTELVYKIKNGDSGAERTLIRQYYRQVVEMLRHRTGDLELARDLAQDTFSILINRLRGEGLQDPEKLAAFIHRTAHNLMVGYFRKEGRHNTRANTELVEVTEDSREGQLESLLAREQGNLVRRLLADMTVARDREILLRFYVWEQNKPEVCQAMELAAAQFDRVISRARFRFRSLVESSAELRK